MSRTRKKAKIREMSLREVKNRLSEAVTLAQESYMLITRHGRPAAVLIGVTGLDMVDVVRRFGEFEVRIAEK